jgi:hypothetical protein
MPGVIYLGTSGNTKADAIVKGASSRNVDAKAMNFHEAKTGVEPQANSVKQLKILK